MLSNVAKFCAFVCLPQFRLDVYIYDYLVKRNLQASAQAFQAEGKVSSDPVGKAERERERERSMSSV
jgi:hypothetical protein